MRSHGGGEERDFNRATGAGRAKEEREGDLDQVAVLASALAREEKRRKKELSLVALLALATWRRGERGKGERRVDVLEKGRRGGEKDSGKGSRRFSMTRVFLGRKKENRELERLVWQASPDPEEGGKKAGELLLA